MRGTKSDLFAVARVGISQFLDASGPEDEYFLEHVSTGPAMQCLFSCDLSHIRAGLLTKPTGKTALIDAIYLALNAMRKARHANRSLLVVSDGYDNNSIYNVRELSRAFADSPVPIFLIIPSENGDRIVASRPGFERQDLVRLVNRSGGYAAVVSERKEILTLVTQLAAAIRTPYMLYFAGSSPRGSISRRGWHVDVPRVRPPPRLYYRNIYYAHQR